MPKQSFTVTPSFLRVKIESADHGAIQRGNDSGVKVRLGLHTPNWRITSIVPGWEMKSRKPTAFLGFELKFEYSGLVQISKKVDPKSECYRLAEAHELEHEDICVSETRAAVGACEKILKSHAEAILKKTYKNDIAAAYDDETAFGRAVGTAAFREMQDGPFYKAADKSAKIDTPSTYAPIDAACQDYAE
jgi:hypothetical protein